MLRVKINNLYYPVTRKLLLLKSQAGFCLEDARAHILLLQAWHQVQGNVARCGSCLQGQIL